MDEIVNYRDLSETEKLPLLAQLSKIGFCPAYGKQRTMKREMDRSQPDTLPQYVFVRRNGVLIGYLFLIGEAEHLCKAFPWWAVNNADELPLDTAARLLEYGVSLCEAGGCPLLAERMALQLENQKKGIGRRPKEFCR